MLPADPSDTAIYVGSLSMTALVSLATALLMGRAWVHRRSDREYLLSSLASTCIAFYSLGLAVSYGAGLWPPGDLDLAFVGARLAIVSIVPVPALMTHVAVLFSRPTYGRRLLLGAYFLTSLFLACCLFEVMWEGPANTFKSKQALGLTIVYAAVLPTIWGKAFFLSATCLNLAVIRELKNSVLEKRSEAHPALLGAAILGLTQLNDIANSLKWVSTVYLMAFGYTAFSVGIVLTMVSRYGARSAELEESNDALGARSQQLTQAYASLESAQSKLIRTQQQAAVGELAAVIAHEVRNPLAIVTNAIVSLNKSTGSVERERSLLTIIDEEVARLDRLAAQLLDYARPLTVKAQTIEVMPLLQRCATIAEAEPELIVEIAPSPAPEKIEGDPLLLRQAIENVIQNATVATEGTGRITIATTASATKVTITISDDGTGMASDVLARATSPFFSTHATGTGLGLAVVQRVIEGHDGELTIDSTEGHGTSVIIELPRHLSSPDVSIAKTLGPDRDFDKAAPLLG